jgi:O-antigen/teichoic acid export membrane protein
MAGRHRFGSTRPVTAMRGSSDAIGQRLAAIFLMGCVAFDDPLLSLFAGRADVAGVPVLYAYLFGGWLLLIALMALAVRRRRD